MCIVPPFVCLRLVQPKLYADDRTRPILCGYYYRNRYNNSVFDMDLQQVYRCAMDCPSKPRKLYPMDAGGKYPFAVQRRSAGYVALHQDNNVVILSTTGLFQVAHALADWGYLDRSPT